MDPQNYFPPLYETGTLVLDVATSDAGAFGAGLAANGGFAIGWGTGDPNGQAIAVANKGAQWGDISTGQQWLKTTDGGSSGWL